MNALATLKQRWQSLAAREKAWVAATGAVVATLLIWLVAIGPALSTLRTAEQQQRTLEGQLRHMRILQAQAQALQAQPKQNRDEAVRLLEESVRQRLGTAARTLITADRVTVTLTGAAPEAVAQWLSQARVNARALPSEARLSRNASGLWEGTLVLTLPPG
jgi:general secretion pathway protein M